MDSYVMKNDDIDANSYKKMYFGRLERRAI